MSRLRPTVVVRWADGTATRRTMRLLQADGLVCVHCGQPSPTLTVGRVEDHGLARSHDTCHGRWLKERKRGGEYKPARPHPAGTGSAS